MSCIFLDTSAVNTFKMCLHTPDRPCNNLANFMISCKIIVNPKSRQGSENLIDSWVDALRERGFTVDVERSTSEEHMQSIILENKDNVDLVIIAGGDGTVNAAAPALLKAKLPFAIIPLGTANDLARAVGMVKPVDIDKVCDAIERRHYRDLDLGTVGKHYFFNVAHVGLGVKVSKALSSESKKFLGVFSYLQAAISALKKRRGFKVELNVDGEKSTLSSIQLAVGNGRYYGGGNLIDCDSAIDDGKLSLYSIKPVSLMTLLTLAPALRRGTWLGHTEVFTVRGQNISVATDQAMHVHADGEPVCETPAEFSCKPSVLKILSL